MSEVLLAAIAWGPWAVATALVAGLTAWGFRPEGDD